jgi:transcriptional regulator with XRE-family HTH domain
MSTIGERIIKARELRGLTRPQLSDLTGIKYPTLAGIENGDQASSTKLHRIATVLRVRVEWLEAGQLPMEAPEIGDERRMGGREGLAGECRHGARRRR